MANGKIRFGKQSGGQLALVIPDGVANTEVTFPESGTLVSVDGSVTDNAIARFDGTTGKLQNSAVVIDDSGNVGICGETTTNGLIVGNLGGYNGNISLRRASDGIQVGSLTVDVTNSKIDLQSGYGTLSLSTGVIERMRIADSGNLLVGATTDNGVDNLQVNGTISSGPIPETSIDVNTLKLITRTYVISNSSANIPIVDYGYLEVIVHNANVWAMQRFTCLGTNASYAGRTFVRCFISGTTWTAWVEK